MPADEMEPVPLPEIEATMILIFLKLRPQGKSAFTVEFTADSRKAKEEISPGIVGFDKFDKYYSSESDSHALSSKTLQVIWLVGTYVDESSFHTLKLPPIYHFSSCRTSCGS